MQSGQVLATLNDHVRPECDAVVRFLNFRS